jgi:hypothetical protein
MLNSMANLLMLNVVPFVVLAIAGAWCVKQVHNQLKG